MEWWRGGVVAGEADVEAGKRLGVVHYEELDKRINWTN